MREIQPWERQDDTDAAWRAFCAFRDLGKSRTMTAAAKKIGLKDPSSLSVMSKKFNWRKRVAAYDRHNDRAVVHARREDLTEKAIVHNSQIDIVQGIIQGSLNQVAKLMTLDENHEDHITPLQAAGKMKDVVPLLTFMSNEIDRQRRTELLTNEEVEEIAEYVTDYSPLPIKNLRTLIELSEELEESTIEMRRQLYKKSYYDFFINLWSCINPDKFSDNWHVEYLCKELQKLGERVVKRLPMKKNLIINIAPGETKSMMVSIFFPVWLHVVDPTLKIITTSYSADLARDHSQKSRDIIMSDDFRLLFGQDVELKRNQNSKSHYATTKGGTRKATSVGGSLTGMHGHVLISDDPVKAGDAYSEAVLNEANTWLKETLPTRKVDIEIVPTILVMQRLSEIDPTAQMAKIWEKQGKLKWIRLPADDRYTIIPEKLKKRYVIDGPVRVMNPLRKPWPVIQDLEIALGTMGSSGQLGQDPRPAEGAIFKKAWFEQRFSEPWLEQEFYKKVYKPDELKKMVGKDKPESFIQWHATLDGGFTSNEQNSATAVLIYAIINGNLYLKTYRKFWLEFNDLIKQLEPWLLSNGMGKNSMLYVEPKAIGLPLVYTLREKSKNLRVSIDPNTDVHKMSKKARALNAAPTIEGMKVFLSENTDWETFIYDVTVFDGETKQKSDDLVDCLVMAVDKLNTGVESLTEIYKKSLERFKNRNK